MLNYNFKINQMHNCYSMGYNRNNWKYEFRFIFLLFIFIILTITTCIICTLGYYNYQQYSNLLFIPLHVQTLRSIGIFLFIWTCFILIWLFRLTIEANMFYGFKKSFYYYLYFIPIINWILFAFLLHRYTFNSFCRHIKFLCQSDPKLKIYNNRKSLYYFLSIITLIIMTPVAVMIWMPEYSFTKHFNQNEVLLNNVWFYGFQYFTLQTNLLCYMLVLIYVINPYCKLFKSKTFFIICTVNIIVVSVTYLGALLPVKFANGSVNSWSWYKWMKTMWEHAINPFFFSLFGFIYIIRKKEVVRFKYFKTIRICLIIPTIYLIYATILPFVTKETVYGFVTNCNPNLPNTESFMPYGAWYIIFFIILYWFLFLGLYSLIWYVKERARIKNAKWTTKKLLSK